MAHSGGADDEDIDALLRSLGLDLPEVGEDADDYTAHLALEQLDDEQTDCGGWVRAVRYDDEEER